MVQAIELSADRLVGIVRELLKAAPREVRVDIAIEGNSYELALNGDRHQNGPLNPSMLPEQVRVMLQPHIPKNYSYGMITYDNEFKTTKRPLMGHIYIIKRAEKGMPLLDAH